MPYTQQEAQARRPASASSRALGGCSTATVFADVLDRTEIMGAARADPRRLLQAFSPAKEDLYKDARSWEFICADRPEPWQGAA